MPRPKPPIRTKICSICTNVYVKSIYCSVVQWNSQRYCSKSCATKSKPRALGAKHTPEMNRRKSELYKSIGHKPAPMYGKDNPNYVEDREALALRYKDRLGAKYKSWIIGVKQRDGWKCKIGNKDCSGNLESHHILRWAEYPELRFNLDNGITLCHFHHPRKRKEEATLASYFQSLITRQTI